MCNVIRTDAIHHGLLDYMEAAEPNRLIAEHEADQYEPWLASAPEGWSDEVINILVSNNALVPVLNEAAA